MHDQLRWNKCTGAVLQFSLQYHRSNGIRPVLEDVQPVVDVDALDITALYVSSFSKIFLHIYLVSSRIDKETWALQEEE